jgi:outer membrane usher protein
VRARYASAPEEFEAEWVRFSEGAVGDVGARLTATRREEAMRLDGEVGHVGPRLELGVRNNTDMTPNALAVARSVTDLRIGAGIGFADGVVGWGRPFSDGFVIVQPHETLGRRRITITEGYGGRVVARSGGLGHALAPITSAYQSLSYVAEVEDLPLGYDLGEGQLRAHPNARAGYVYRVGSAAANTVLAVLRTPDGEPVAFAVGELSSESGDGEPIAFFTNRAGRLAAERVSPGRYVVVLNSPRRVVGNVDVPAGEAGLVDLGVITIAETP